MIRRICLTLAVILVALANGAVSDNALPSSESFPLTVISAQAAMAKADNGSAVYDRVLIIGDFILNNNQNNPIKITNSIFRDNVSCKGITFYGNVDFENTTFQRNAIFNETKFMTMANFNATRFLGEASFNMSRFPDGGNFDFADFNRLADFDSSWFDKFATFYDVTFNGDAQFAFSEFNGAYANFESVHCIGDVYFYGSQFNSYGTFADARLEKMADFHATKYSNGAGFYHTQFLGRQTLSALTSSRILSSLKLSSMIRPVSQMPSSMGRPSSMIRYSARMPILTVPNSRHLLICLMLHLTAI